MTEDNTQFGQEVPLLIGMKTEDTILEAMKEGEIELLDSIWKQVKNNQSLSKLWDEVRLQKAVVQVAKAVGEEPPEFKDHSPYLNRGMGDLLERNKLISMTWTEIIPPRSNKTIKGRIPLVLMGTHMNVMTEPLR